MTRVKILQDETVLKAVLNIIQRAERNEDDVIDKTFVDIGAYKYIDNRNNSIIYGRRGTGKTHLFNYHKCKISSNRMMPVYIDCRVLGSASVFNDVGLPMSVRCKGLFVDVLQMIYKDTQKHCIENGLHVLLGESLEVFEKAICPRETYVANKVTDVVSKEDRANCGVNASTEKGFGANISESDSTKIESKKESERIVDDKVYFPDVYSSLSDICIKGGFSIYLFVDEWSSLPLDIQPYLAEMIKRGLLPSRHITIKVAALEYRSAFLTPDRAIGIEVGADLSTTIDLDELMVYDNNRNVINIYRSMMYLHTCVSLDYDYLSRVYGILNANSFCDRLFTENSIQELARAAEGVPRDLINLFAKAYIVANKDGSADRIEVSHVRTAAQQWFELDKKKALNEELNSILSHLVVNVVASKRSRSFMINQNFDSNSTLQRLYDCRVIHKIIRGCSDRDKSGNKYNVYALDYGTYVSTLNTVKKVQLDLFSNHETYGSEKLIALEDNRNFRRIIVTEADLSVKK